MKQSGAPGALGTLESPDAGAPTLAEINLCKLRGQSSVAIALAQQRLESVPDCATTHALLGELYENAGHITDARHHFALAVDCAPGNQDHADRLRRVMGMRTDTASQAPKAQRRSLAGRSPQSRRPRTLITAAGFWYAALPQSVKIFSYSGLPMAQ